MATQLTKKSHFKVVNASSGELSYRTIRVPTTAGTMQGFRAWAHSREFPQQPRISFLRDRIWIDFETLALDIPVTACTLAGFQEWALSDRFPTWGRITFLGQEILVDMSPEELATHNAVKTEVTRVGSNLAREQDRGIFFSDRTLVTNEEADLSTEPDGTFVSWQRLKSGAVRLQPKKDRHGQFIQLKGSPDWTAEIVSDSSVKKDTKELREKYFRAGIGEYWLIDARGGEIVFQILYPGPHGYVATRRRQGWLWSRVWQRSFRLERKRSRLGFWQYTLHVKPE